jgi:UDP-glucose 4-epimerase
MSNGLRASAAVALVGGSGLVGGALAQRLAQRRRPVVVADRVAPPLAGVAHAHVDLLDDDAEDLLARAFVAHDVDVVVHLAARVDPPRDDDDRLRMRRLHEQSTRATVRAAQRAHVRRFVLVSSAVVYGAWPDNPVPLEVEAAVRPCPFPYAVDKAMQEQVARDAWGDDGFVVVRPAIVYAPHARSYLTEILRRARWPVGLPGLPRGILPALDGHRPPLQFVHVDDVAAVLEAVALGDVTGVLHACPADWLTYDEVARVAGLAVVDVDARWIGRLLDVLVPLLPPSLRAPSTLFPYLMHPFVLSSTSTSARLDVQPTWSSAAALRAMLARR